MNHISIHPAYILVLLAALSGCASGLTVSRVDAKIPETLTIREDGSMWYRDRPLPERDVIIYPDGTGGEKAAVRVRVAPLHPDFFRDTIVVDRE